MAPLSAPVGTMVGTFDPSVPVACNVWFSAVSEGTGGSEASAEASSLMVRDV
jgi:hypothetical protein